MLCCSQSMGLASTSLNHMLDGGPVMPPEGCRAGRHVRDPPLQAQQPALWSVQLARAARHGLAVGNQYSRPVAGILRRTMKVMTECAPCIQLSREPRLASICARQLPKHMHVCGPAIWGPYRGSGRPCEVLHNSRPQGHSHACKNTAVPAGCLNCCHWHPAATWSTGQSV